MTYTKMPRIQCYTLGPYQTNCYVVQSDQGSFVVDCGFMPSEMLDYIEEMETKPEAFVLTHAHLDHIAGLNDARARFPKVPIWIHEAEENWLLDAEANMSALAGFPITAPSADRILRDGHALNLAGEKWTVLHTPGHSPGGITLYSEALETAFVGDALFAGSIGRTDFPGASMEVLERSIREKLYTLPRDTKILPGHGPTSTIGLEMDTNPFVKPA